MTLNPTIERLRDLLQAQTAKAWVEICTLVDAIEAPADLEMVIGYVNDHTASWDPSRLTAPARWAFDALDAEVDQPRLRIVRHLDLQMTHRGPVQGTRFLLPGPYTIGFRLEEAHIAQLCANPWLEALRLLNLSDNRLEASALRVLAERGRFSHLRELRLSGNEVAEVVGPLLRSSLTTRLERLALGSLRDDDAPLESPVEALATTTRLGQLRWLEVDIRGFGGWEHLDWIASNPHLRREVREALGQQARDAQLYEEEHE